MQFVANCWATLPVPFPLTITQDFLVLGNDQTSGLWFYALGKKNHLSIGPWNIDMEKVEVLVTVLD